MTNEQLFFRGYNIEIKSITFRSSYGKYDPINDPQGRTWGAEWRTIQKGLRLASGAIVSGLRIGIVKTWLTRPDTLVLEVSTGGNYYTFTRIKFRDNWRSSYEYSPTIYDYHDKRLNLDIVL